MNYLGPEDTAFHLDLINLVQRQSVRDLEVVLTNLWLKVIHDNRRVKPRSSDTKSTELAQQFVHDPDSPFGFPDVSAADAWLRSEALVMLKGTSYRRRIGEFVVARPVHDLATRVRNNKAANDFGTANVAYAWLQESPDVLEDLKSFLHVSVSDAGDDLTTYALALLGDSVGPDAPQSEPQTIPAPTCRRLGRQYAEDIARLLSYQRVLPRIALVEHLARITGLYIGLYLLTTFETIISLERTGADEPCGGCSTNGTPSECRFKVELFVDCSERAGTRTATIAELSWREHEDALIAYLTSHVRLKKFHEFAERNNRNEHRNQIPIDDLPTLCRSARAIEHRDQLVDWANDRIQAMKERLSDADKRPDRERFEELRDAFAATGDGFDSYVSLILHTWMGKWHNYYLQVLDYVFAGSKNKDGLLRQPIGGSKRRRRAVLGTQIVESLSLLVLLRREDGAWQPQPLRVDEVVDEIAERYGLLIDRLPRNEVADPSVATALDINLQTFKLRLREAGLFRDLSDAYLAQVVTPRFGRLERE